MNIIDRIKLRLRRIDRRLLVAIIIFVSLIFLYIIALLLRTPERKAVDAIKWDVTPSTIEETKKKDFLSPEYDIYYSNIDQRFIVSVKTGKEFDFEMVKDRIYYDLKKAGFTFTDLTTIEFLDYRNVSGEQIDPFEGSTTEEDN